jgi:tetratricopeptide (TPR) repeat protein
MRRGIVSMLLCAAVVLAAGSADWDKAHQLYQRTEYRQSLALLPKNSVDVPTLQLIGQNYFMLGEYKQATEVFEKAVAVDPKNAVCFHWLGRTYGRRAETGNPFTAPGYATKARQLFEKSIELDPANQEAVNDLFDFYLEAPGFLGGGLHKAEQLANHIAKLDAAEGFYAQAQLADKRKEFDAAEAHLYERASTYIKDQRNLHEARELLERYVKSPLTPDDPPREHAAALLKKIGA